MDAISKQRYAIIENIPLLFYTVKFFGNIEKGNVLNILLCISNIYIYIMLISTRRLRMAIYFNSIIMSLMTLFNN